MKQKWCNKYLTFLVISVSLNGTGTVGGFLSTLIPSVRGSKIFGFKALAFTCILKDKTQILVLIPCMQITGINLATLEASSISSD
jgi:hypothetical protein